MKRQADEGARGSFAVSQRAAKTGVSVRATTSEVSTAAEIVRPKGRKKLPTTPPIRPTGTKTATMVSVAAVTVRPISSVARRTAARVSVACGKWRAIFSTSTIASSMMMPMTSASASKVIVSNWKPASAIARNVPSSEVGIASAEIAVAATLRRNG